MENKGKMIICNEKYIKSHLKTYVLKKGTRLYRFVSVSPKKYNKNFNNKGLPGRYNYYENVYYCTKNIASLKYEFPNGKIQGVLVESIVTEDIYINFIDDCLLNMISRGIQTSEETAYKHKNILKNCPNLYFHVDNKYPSKLFSYCNDGLQYTPINTFEFVYNDNFFHIDDDTFHVNVALNEKGISKIKELPPFVFWL